MMDRRSEQPCGGGLSPSYWPEELFRSTAPYYARYRSGYLMELFRHLARRLGDQRSLIGARAARRRCTRARVARLKGDSHGNR
jgi:hypothetical protein